MSKINRNVFLMCIVLFLGLPVFGQTVPCRAGTMADVLGTSCSVGPMIFNFRNSFDASFAVFGIESGPITPAEIGFIPILEEHRAGFKLLLNFTDATAPGGFHVVSFDYSPQAAPGFEIRRQGLSMDAVTQSAPSGFAFAEGFDSQSYTNSRFEGTATLLGNTDGVSDFNQLSNEVFLQVPGFLSTGFGSTIETLANGPASSTLRSQTILYTFGPVVPVFRPAPLTYASLDLPGTAATFVSNITNSGKTVGSYLDLSGAFHAYVAEPDGRFTTIDVPGAVATFGTGLSGHGEVVGTYNDAAGLTHGFVQKDGAITNLDGPQAIFTTPIAVNDKGQIVGQYQTADRAFHGFLVDDGVFTTIDHGPETTTFVSVGIFVINDKGVFGGPFFNPDTFRSFLQKGDDSKDLDVPGQGNSFIEGINNQGDLVGTFDDINFVEHGFVRADGVYRTVAFPGSSDTFPLGINSSGTIVGEYSDSFGQFHSFIATPTRDDRPDRGPETSVAIQPGQRPDCTEAWQRHKAQLRNGGSCQIKH